MEKILLLQGNNSRGLEYYFRPLNLLEQWEYVHKESQCDGCSLVIHWLSDCPTA